MRRFSFVAAIMRRGRSAPHGIRVSREFLQAFDGNRRQIEREDGDVVVLAELLCGLGDGGGGLVGEGGCAVEPEELAGGAAGFDDAVGQQG